MNNSLTPLDANYQSQWSNPIDNGRASTVLDANTKKHENVQNSPSHFKQPQFYNG